MQTNDQSKTGVEAASSAAPQLLDKAAKKKLMRKVIAIVAAFLVVEAVALGFVFYEFNSQGQPVSSVKDASTSQVLEASHAEQ